MSRTMHPLRRRVGMTAAGFTLIEILVVVAIIALLVAVLLPSLKRARDQAKALVCLTHQKQLGVAFEYYHVESKNFLPPFCFIRRVNNNPNDFLNVPAWYQYITYRYLYDNTDVTVCPVDDLIEVQYGGKRGPAEDLKTLASHIYYSYAINAVFPKNSTPITTDPNDVSPRLASTEMPSGTIERFNPGLANRVKRPSDTFFMLETASPEMMNPRMTARSWFRTDHGADKDQMNVVMADGHAGPRRIRDVWPADYTKSPPVHYSLEGLSLGQWPARFRQWWFGDGSDAAVPIIEQYDLLAE